MCGIDFGLEEWLERERQSEFGDDPCANPVSLHITLPRPEIIMTNACFQHIIGDLSKRAPEAGGLLLGPAEDDLVTHYVPDENGKATAASFTLDAEGLNVVLRQFRECRMNAKGLVHSHPLGCREPSGADVEYVRRSLANPKNQEAKQFLLPIVCGQRMWPYIIRRGEHSEVLTATLVLV